MVQLLNFLAEQGYKVSCVKAHLVYPEVEDPAVIYVRECFAYVHSFNYLAYGLAGTVSFQECFWSIPLSPEWNVSN